MFRRSSRIGLVGAFLLLGGGFFGAPPARAADFAPPTISIYFDAQAIGMVNGWSTLTIVIENPNGAPITGVGFTDTLTPGILFANPDSVTTNCSEWPSAGGPTLTLADATLDAGATCTISVDVLGVESGPQTSTTSAVTSNEGGNGNTDSAGLFVAYPAVTTAVFGDASIPFGGSTTLTFKVTNPNATQAAPSVRPAVLSEFFGGLSDLGFIDALPAGLVVATPNGVTGSCGGGTITATAGSGSVTLAGASLAAGASCTFAVSVKGVGAGNQQNSTGAVNSAEGGPGGPGTGSVVVGNAPAVATPTPANATPTPVVTPPTTTTGTRSGSGGEAPLGGLALLLIACWLTAAVAIRRQARTPR